MEKGPKNSGKAFLPPPPFRTMHERKHFLRGVFLYREGLDLEGFPNALPREGFMMNGKAILHRLEDMVLDVW